MMVFDTLLQQEREKVRRETTDEKEREAQVREDLSNLQHNITDAQGFIADIDGKSVVVRRRSPETGAVERIGSIAFADGWISEFCGAKVAAKDATLIEPNGETKQLPL